MASSHVELVRALYTYTQSAGNLCAAYEDEDWVGSSVAAFGHLAHPELEFVLVRGEVVGGDVYRGVEGFMEGMRDWLRDWERYEIEAEGFMDLGDRVLVLTLERGVSRS